MLLQIDLQKKIKVYTHPHKPPCARLRYTTAYNTHLLKYTGTHLLNTLIQTNTTNRTDSQGCRHYTAITTVRSARLSLEIYGNILSASHSLNWRQLESLIMRSAQNYLSCFHSSSLFNTFNYSDQPIRTVMSYKPLLMAVSCINIYANLIRRWMYTISVFIL